MQKTIIKFILLPSLFIVLFSAIYYNGVQYEVDNLIHQRYLEATQQDKRQLNTLIQEKQENILAVSLAISKYSSIKDVLLGEGNKELKLKEFSKLLRTATSLKNLWFQIIDKNGKSLYRSFSDKKGDILCKDRIEVHDIIDYPRVISTISVGKFSITYKSLVPIYYEGKFIGVFETLAHFNSISQKLKQKGLDSILLVDKAYKKQMIHSIHKTFIKEYNLVSLKPNPQFLRYLQEIKPEEILKHTAKAYIINKEQDVLVSSYHLHDYLENDLGYYILFKNLDDIDISDVVQLKNNLYLLYGILLLITYIFLYYRYKRMKDLEIEKKNRKLEEKIRMKNNVLEYVSLHDSLTSLPNRKLFTKRLEDMLSQKSTARYICVIYIGIDKLKEINDLYTHDTGDKIIQGTAKVLIDSLEENTLIARLTADEFSIALSVNNPSSMDVITNKILKNVQKIHTIKEKNLQITVSIGLSTTINESTPANLLLGNANTAMYKAKSLGGNCYQRYTQEMTTNLLDKRKLDDDLKHAIKNDEFEPYFQPQIDAQTNTIVGMEALVRWIHPKLGIIYPDRFIPYAEESGLIIDIDRIMMRKSMKIIMSWEKQYSEELKLSLNLSAVHLESDNFIQELKNTLIQTNFNAKNLELEMLESQIMKDQESSIQLLMEIKELGISISIDDFGTGYSSLSALKKLPISKLKIDKSFVDNLPYDKDDVAIVETIIALANALKLKLIAEGVENEEQRDFLLQHQCCTIQGYFYSKPLCQKDFKEFMIKFPN